MPYVAADTRPKVGFRPYHQTDSFAAAHLSGIPPGGMGRELTQRLYGMGQEPPGAGDPDWPGYPLPSESTTSIEEQDIFGIGQNLHDAWSLLNEIDSTTDDPRVEAAIGNELRAAFSQWQSYADQYTEIYQFIFGSTPTGLQGVGALGSVLVPISIFVALGTLSAAVYYFWSQVLPILQTRAQTALVEAQTEYEKQLPPEKRSPLPGPPGQPTDFFGWFQQNWKWVALAGVGIVAAGPITQGIFGGGRRR